jgi:hypothetical protein
MLGPPYNGLLAVSGDGEHHDATGATLDFCCRHGRTRSLRLHLQSNLPGARRGAAVAHELIKAHTTKVDRIAKSLLAKGSLNQADLLEVKENGSSFGPEP